MRDVLHNGQLVRQVLVQWLGSSPEEATWEWLSDFQVAYPSYHLEDKVVSEGEGNVTSASITSAAPKQVRPKRATTSPVWHSDYVMG